VAGGDFSCFVGKTWVKHYDDQIVIRFVRIMILLYLLIRVYSERKEVKPSPARRLDGCHVSGHSAGAYGHTVTEVHGIRNKSIDDDCISATSLGQN